MTNVDNVLRFQSLLRWIVSYLIFQILSEWILLNLIKLKTPLNIRNKCLTSNSRFKNHLWIFTCTGEIFVDNSVIIDQSNEATIVTPDINPVRREGILKQGRLYPDLAKKEKKKERKKKKHKYILCWNLLSTVNHFTKLKPIHKYD